MLEVWEETGEMPKALRNKPDLLRGATVYLDAYYVLHKARGYNEAGRQPITVTEIRSYLTLAGITGVERKTQFLTLIQSLDQVALNYYAEQAERERAKK